MHVPFLPPIFPAHAYSLDDKESTESKEPPVEIVYVAGDPSKDSASPGTLKKYKQGMYHINVDPNKLTGKNRSTASSG